MKSKTVKFRTFATLGIIPLLAGCNAAMNPPTTPAVQVAPNVKLLWPTDHLSEGTSASPFLQSTLSSTPKKSNLGIDNGIIAVVNQKAITLKEFDNAFFRALQNPSWRGNEKELFNLVLDQLIERQLFLNYASTFKDEEAIVISDHMVEQELNRMVSNIDGGWEAYRRLLESEKMSIEDIELQIKENMTIQRAQAEIFRGMGMPSPKEIQREYENRIHDFSSPEKRSISLITVYLGDYQQNPRKGKKLVADIEKALMQGTAFENVAKEFSDGAKAQQGGLQGWIGPEELAKDISDVAFQLEAFSHSGPHRMDQLVFFVRCNGIQPAQAKSFSDVREQIQQSLYHRQRTTIKNKKLQQLSANSHIERLSPDEYLAYRKGL